MILCYLAMEPPIWQQSTRQLSRQAEILAKEAWLWPLAPETLARARANIEREMDELPDSPEAEAAAEYLTSVVLKEGP